LSRGLGVVYKRPALVMRVPPIVRHAEMFRKLASEAREHRRGLWAP
jgi:endonuclease YncB( thermonuclease family)